MAQGDYLIQNQSFPSFRSDLNSTLEAINTSNSGTSRPTSAVAGTVWLDTTNATNPTLKFYDGTDDISLAQLDYSANTVNWLDSTVVSDLVNDTTPQLGGDLDVNGNSIVSVSNGNITFTPDGTGKVIIDGLSYPTADGTNGQALITDGSGNLSFSTVGGVLTGEIKMYSSASIPSGYLNCDGSAVSRTTYADLFAVVGTTYGSGDGSTTFNLPDLQDNHPIGVSGTKALGTKAGSASTTLAETNLATHTHGLLKTNYSASQVNIGAVQGRQNAYVTSSSVGNAGSGTAIDTFPPYIALKFIIKT